MTNDKLREALKWAKGWYEWAQDDGNGNTPLEPDITHLPVLIEAARAALAVPVEAEPVAPNVLAPTDAIGWLRLIMCYITECPACDMSNDGRIHESHCELGKFLNAHPAKQAVEAEDAARYRWLRDDADADNFPSEVHEALQLGGDSLDAAIDAARNAKPAKGG